MKIGSKLLGLLILATFLMSACVQSPQTGNAGTTNNSAPASGKIKIGFAMATVKEERWQSDCDVF